jgi:hypothetical protein
MILRVSAAFAKQFKCDLSHEGERLPQERRMDSWSCHFVRVRRKPLVVVMNDATLYTLILPVSGAKKFPDLWMRLLDRMADVWERHGVAFDTNHQSVVVMARTNRSLIRLMNDAILLIRHYDFNAGDEGRELDLAAMEIRSNQTPYKALGFVLPEELMTQALKAISEME